MWLQSIWNKYLDTGSGASWPTGPYAISSPPVLRTLRSNVSWVGLQVLHVVDLVNHHLAQPEATAQRMPPQRRDWYGDPEPMLYIDDIFGVNFMHHIFKIYCKLMGQVTLKLHAATRRTGSRVSCPRQSSLRSTKNINRARSNPWCAGDI